MMMMIIILVDINVHFLPILAAIELLTKFVTYAMIKRCTLTASRQ